MSRRILSCGEGKRGLLYDGLRPKGDVYGIALEQLSVGHAKKQSGFSVIYRVVIDIDAVGNRCHTLAVEDGLLIARNDFGDGHIVTTFQYALRYARGIDGGVACGYKEYSDEVA